MKCNKKLFCLRHHCFNLTSKSILHPISMRDVWMSVYLDRFESSRAGEIVVSYTVLCSTQCIIHCHHLYLSMKCSIISEMLVPDCRHYLGQDEISHLAKTPLHIFIQVPGTG